MMEDDYQEGIQHASSSHSGGNSEEKKRRRRTTKKELQVLEALYEESRNPTYEARLKACASIGFEMKALQVWLQNRRQKEKKDSTKWKPSYTGTGESASSTYSVSPRPESGTFAPASKVPRVPSSSSSTTVHTDNVNLQLPPIVHSLKQSPSPHLKNITLPPISTVIAAKSFSARDSMVSQSNKLSPMLHQDENTFMSSTTSSTATTCFSSFSTSPKPTFERANSTDSAFSLSSSICSSVNLQREDSSSVITNSKIVNVPTASKPHSTFRRTSSQYSLSMTNDGKAQMKVTELCSHEHTVPEQHTKPVLPSLVTAILAPSSASSARSALASFPNPARQQTTIKQPLALASAPLSTYGTNSSLPFPSLSTGRPAGRVLSLPSLSTFSSTASIKPKSTSGPSIFAGGLRHGSPPKKPTPASSTHLSSQESQRQLWDNLDSDPIEPEDEALANHNKRLMDSPVRRISVRMEDVLSSSRKKRKATGSPDGDIAASSPKASTVFRKDHYKINNNPSKSATTSTPAKRSRLSMDVRLQSASIDPRLPSTGNLNLTRPRGYSKSMLSRSMSLDRAILQDDSTDEEISPMKKAPKSAGLFQSGAFLGRPPLARANTHVGLMHADPAKSQSRPLANKDAERMSNGKPTTLPNDKDEDMDASGDEDQEDLHQVIPRAAQCIKSPSSIDTSVEEPDLTFSTEASQSFDNLDTADISEAKVTTHTSVEFPALNTRPHEKHQNDLIKQQPAVTALTTPSKGERLSSGTLTQAARHGQMSSPLKMGSPIKNGKIPTEVERDCAAVLVGLGFPDV